MFTVYVDDSGTDPNQRVAIAAAWIAPSTRWVGFEQEWKRFMEKEGFKCFHTSECVYNNPKSEFASWNDEKKLRAIRRMRQLIRKYAVHGIGLAIFKDDFDEVVNGEFRELVGKYHYTIAIRSLLGDVKRWRKPRSARALKFEYIFDWMQPNTDGRREEVESILSIAHLATGAFESLGVYAGFYSFRHRCETVQLQAADLFAWSLYQAARKKYLNASMHPIAAETLLDFETYDDGNGNWLDLRIWEKQRLRDWVKQTTENGTIEKIKRLREVQEAGKKRSGKGTAV